MDRGAAAAEAEAVMGFLRARCDGPDVCVGRGGSEGGGARGRRRAQMAGLAAGDLVEKWKGRRREARRLSWRRRPTEWGSGRTERGGRRTDGEEKVGTGFCLHFVLFRSRDGFC
jgi:hypothetical protein